MLTSSNVQTLSREECRRLLTTTAVGRVVLSVGALPAAFPVNYVFDHNAIVFRTSSDTTLTAALDGCIVAFEVDELNPAEHRGWSVLVVGPSRVVTDPAERIELDRLGIDSWADSELSCYVEIDAERISGRNVQPPPR